MLQHPTTYPTVICPGCLQPMRVESIESVPGNLSLQKTIYRCEKCSVETDRLQKKCDK